MKLKHFINLTNGLEAISKYNLDVNKLNYMYIASTTLERKDYIKLLNDLDHNFLFNLAIGNEVIFYDFGTNRMLSKTCYFAIPFIKYVLTRFWLDKNDSNLCYRHPRHSKEIRFPEWDRFNEIYNSIFIYDTNKEKNFIKTKLKKYKNKFLNTNEIKLDFICSSTINDGNYEYYKQIIKQI